jgi:ABC-2 type transport system ATP-binding protein
MIGQSRLIDAIGRSADQDEAPVAITAIDIAMLVDLEKHARMTERGATGNIGRAVTGDTAMADMEGFGRGDHEGRIASWGFGSNRSAHRRRHEVLLAIRRRPPIPPAMTEAAIAIEGLSKTYQGGKRALDDVSFEVPRGQIFGLLGPNGAGKSTLINILAGLVNKTSGAASIWGFDIDQHPRNAKVSIGIVNQEILFDPFFSPFETLEIQAGLYGVPKAKRRTMELLRAVYLEDKANAYARTLSGGMKRRLMVAKAMVHSPPVLVLDEPTAGVDIELRQQLWAYVRGLNRQGVTVVLTTHYLEEAEQLCDRIAIINHGKVIANEPTRDLVGKATEKLVEVTVDRDVATLPDAACFQKIELKGSRVLAITYSKDKVNAGEVLAAVQADGYGIVDVSTREADLEDVFLNLTRAANG